MSARRTPPARVLVVDDDHRYSEWLRHHLDVLCPQDIEKHALAVF